MRRILAHTAIASIISVLVLLAPSAGAMTVGTVSGIQKSLGKTGVVEPVVRVCWHNIFTSRRECWVDRSRPPTVCHHIRSTSRRDCY